MPAPSSSQGTLAALNPNLVSTCQVGGAIFIFMSNRVLLVFFWEQKIFCLDLHYLQREIHQKNF